MVADRAEGFVVITVGQRGFMVKEEKKVALERKIYQAKKKAVSIAI